MARDDRFDRDRNRRRYRRTQDEGGFWDRAGDEMRQWFKGDEPERRRGDVSPWGPFDADEVIHNRDFEMGHRYGSGRFGQRGGREYDRSLGSDYGGGAYYDSDYDWEYNRYYDRDYSRGYDRDHGRGAGRHGYRYSEPDVRGSDIGGGGYARNYSGSLYAPDGPHVGRGPKGYQRSDARLVEDASDRLTRHGHLDPSDIQVTAKDGEITLEGTVESRRDKRMAEDAVESITGVRDVHNHLRVKR